MKNHKKIQRKSLRESQNRKKPLKSLKMAKDKKNHKKITKITKSQKNHRDHKNIIKIIKSQKNHRNHMKDHKNITEKVIKKITKITKNQKKITKITKKSQKITRLLGFLLQTVDFNTFIKTLLPYMHQAAPKR